MQVQAEVSGPSGPVQVEFDPQEGKGQFTAREHGMHEVLVTNEGEAVKVDIYNIYSIYNIYNIYISINLGRPPLHSLHAELQEGLRRHRAVRGGLHRGGAGK